MALVVASIVAACGGAEETTTTTTEIGTEAPATTTAAETTTSTAADGAARDDPYGPATGATSTTATTATTVASEPMAGGLMVTESDLGEHLSDADGNTLYLFVPDEQGPSTCYDSCASNWPALEGPVEAGEGVDADLLGTASRDDGTEQATYNGWPLYYFVNDNNPGEVNGHGIESFGGIWYLVTPAGERAQVEDGGSDNDPGPGDPGY